MTTQLTTNEQALLAREIAIDQHGYRNYGMRAFTDGWDAALAWMEEQRGQEQGQAELGTETVAD